MKWSELFSPHLFSLRPGKPHLADETNWEWHRAPLIFSILLITQRIALASVSLVSMWTTTNSAISMSVPVWTGGRIHRWEKNNYVATGTEIKLTEIKSIREMKSVEEHLILWLACVRVWYWYPLLLHFLIRKLMLEKITEKIFCLYTILLI